MKITNKEIGLIVSEYENRSRFEAINYRGVEKRATIKNKILAFKRDLRWYEDHSQEVLRVSSFLDANI